VEIKAPNEGQVVVEIKGELMSSFEANFDGFEVGHDRLGSRPTTGVGLANPAASRSTRPTPAVTHFKSVEIRLKT
jgi:hypothetical protein